MISPKGKHALVVGLALTALAVIAAWNYSYMSSKQAGAAAAMADLEGCRQVTADIDAMRGKTAMASSEATGEKELGERIDAAKRQANLTDAAFKSIFPQQAHPFGNTPYLEKATSLELQGVPLPQLALFLYHVTDGSDLGVRDLRIREPNGNASQGLWDADVTLTYLIYAPSGRAQASDR